MQTIVTTDATTVRLRQHPKRKKKWIVWGLFMLIVLICSVLVYIRYLHNRNEDNPEQPRQPQYILFENSIESVATNDNGIVNDAPNPPPRICTKTTWLEEAVTIVGGNGNGSALNQLAHPNDMFVDSQNAIYIVDSINNRIVKWDEGASEGRVVAGGNRKGNQTNQLNHPTAVFVDRRENIYVADNGNNRIQKWPKNGIFGEMIIRYIGACWGLYVDKEYNVYVSEFSNNRVTKWSPGAQSGRIVLESRAPTEIHVHEPTGDIFVASYTENPIKQFAANGSLIHQFGKELVKGPFGFVINSYPSSKTGMSDSAEKRENQLNKPRKVQFDSRGNVLVLDSDNHRVQKFPIKNKSCVVAYPDYRLSSYPTTTQYLKSRYHVNMNQKYNGQEPVEEVRRSKEKSSPRDEIFFPIPPFGAPLPFVDDDVRQTGKDSLIDLHGIPSFPSNFRRIDSDINRPSSSFSGRSGRRG